MTTTTLDPGVLTDVDLEALLGRDVYCEVRLTPLSPECGKPASWRFVVICPACSRDGSSNVCDPHRRAMIPVLNRPKAALVCPGCKGWIQRWSWRPL